MSTFSTLFGGSKEPVDGSVSDLFSKTTGPVSENILHRKRTLVEVRAVEDQNNRLKKSIEEKDEQATNANSEDESESTKEESVEAEAEVESKASKKRKAENYDLEAKYFNKLLKEEEKENKAKQHEEAKEEVKEEVKEEEESNDSDSDDSDNDQKEVSETHTKTKAAKQIDLKDTELEKTERTVFVNNVSSKAITNKSTYKQFKQLFANYGPVESIRFRSISFDEALPRKFAYAKRALHNTRDTVNAYVVFKEKDASLKAAKSLNATIFEENHLRTDHVAHPAPKDTRKTIFVGNLDFEEKEENLWRYFQSKTDNDVESVRIVRDSKTNVGKGFALIQFKDTLSVNKALLLNDKPITYTGDSKKGRKLRISRAKKNAKPSILSPNHFDNLKKQHASKKALNLTEQQKTKLGRAQTVLGKADRSTAGKSKKIVLEGARAVKGQKISGIKGLKGNKAKKPRITKRSAAFKKENTQENKNPEPAKKKFKKN